MRVNLIYPRHTEVARNKERTELPPLGMLYVASALREKGHKVKVVDIDEKTKELPDSDVDGLAITASTTLEKFKKLSKNVLENRDSIKIAGNTHSHIYPLETLEELGLDMVVMGEAEGVLPRILDRMEKSDNLAEAVFDIPGIAWIDKKKEKPVVTDWSKNQIISLDELVFPARDLMNREDILLENRMVGKDKLLTTVITSRGCPYSCAYCGNLNNGKVRYRSGENFREEVLDLMKKYPKLGGLLIMDETFTLNKRHTKNIANSIKDLDISYVATSRADKLSPDVVKYLKNSGCVEIKLGIESGSQALLEKMNKKAEVKDFIDGIKTAFWGGINVKLFIMHGFPGENEETTADTIKLLKKVRPFVRRVALYRFVPLPGSPVFNNPVKYNLLDKNDFTNRHIYKNNHHWWGTGQDFEVMDEQYRLLKKVVEDLYGKEN